MRTTEIIRNTLSAWPPVEPPPGSKRLSTLPLLNDERGVTILLAALLFSILSVALAMVIDIGGIALRREQLTTMAEAGAAGGGSEVAKYISNLATVHTGGRVLSEEELAHPERFLDDTDRAKILNTPEFITTVKIAAQEIIEANMPPAGSKSQFDLHSTHEIDYPAREVDCNIPDKSFAVVKVTAHANYEALLGGLTSIFTGSSPLTLQKESYYRLRICP